MEICLLYLYHPRNPATSIMASTGSTGSLPQVITTSSHPALSSSSRASLVNSDLSDETSNGLCAFLSAFAVSNRTDAVSLPHAVLC